MPQKIWYIIYMYNFNYAEKEKLPSKYFVPKRATYPYQAKKEPSFYIKKEKKTSNFKAGVAACFWSVILFFTTSVNSKSFLEPVYINRINNRALQFKAETIYAPTLNYMSNLNFMGQNHLAPIFKKGREKILSINSTGELQSLKSEIENISENYKHLHAGVFVYDYMSGKTVQINQDEVFPSASIIKIPVLLDLFNRSKNLENEGFEPVDINNKMTFEESHRTEGSGELQFTKANADYTLDYLAKIMIRKSDNSATNMLLEYNGGINEINSSLRHWGFSKTQVSNWLPDLRGTNTTSPKEIGTMLYNIDNQKFIPKKSALIIKEYMSKVENRTLIKSQVPDSATLIHKTGDIGTMLGDAAIIYTPSGKKIILVVMVKRPHNDYSARDLIQKISKAVYQKLG